MINKLLVWRDEWSLGIGVLDADHRVLINNLIDISLRFCPQAAPLAAPLGGRGPGPAADTRSGPRDLIEALIDFGNKVRIHCRREETFMRAIGYAGADAHAVEHVGLLARFDALVWEWRSQQVRVFDEAAQEAVRHWLISHILASDREFARFYFALCGLDERGRENACGG